MIEGRKVLGIIPARGGSKGLPGKNIIPLAGEPLISWTIKAASKSRFLDHLVLSSDDEQIIKVAKECGVDVPFIRPEHLSTDSASSIDVILHALEYCPDYDIFVLLQPTSPLRTVIDLDDAIKKMVALNAPCCVSLCASEKSPYISYKINDNKKISPLMSDIQTKTNNRQDLPRTYYLNGAVYVAYVDWFQMNRSFLTTETIGYVMPRERSVDIDDSIDLIVAETILKETQVSD